MSLPAGGFRTVIFDCDSTLAAIEGIDELAGPHRDEIQALTDAAVGSCSVNIENEGKHEPDQTVDL